MARHLTQDTEIDETSNELIRRGESRSRDLLHARYRHDRVIEKRFQNSMAVAGNPPKDNSRFCAIHGCAPRYHLVAAAHLRSLDSIQDGLRRRGVMYA